MRKLVIFSGAFASALFAGIYLLPGEMAIPACCAAALLLIAAVVFLRGEKRRALAIGLSGALLAFGYLPIYNAVKIAPVEGILSREQGSVTITSFPEETSYGIKCSGEIGGVKALVYLDGEYLNVLRPGDTVTAGLKIRSLSEDTSYSYYRSSGILLKVSVKDNVTVSHPERVPVKYLPTYAAEKLKQSIDSCFHGDTAAFMRALLLGDKSSMDDGTYSQLKNSGLAHMVAVSGLHISFLVALITRLRLRRRLTAIITVPVLVFFAFVTGCTPSVVRAVVMSVMLLIAPILNREGDSPTALAFALLITLLGNPYAIQSVSLQLSYSSVIGILLFYSRIAAFLRGESKNRLRRFLCDSVSLSLSASVLTIPISACYFGTVSLLSPLSNILTSYVVSFLFPLGLLTATVGIFFPALGGILAWVLYFPARYVLLAAEVISSVPFARVSARGPVMISWLVFAYGVFAVTALTRGWKKRWYIPTGAVACSLCLVSLANALYTDSIPLTFTVLDVGQGQAIVVTAGDKTAIIDAGGYSSAGTIEDYLLSLGRKSADVMLLTHLHKDHCLYAEDILENINVDTLIIPRCDDDDGMEQGIISAAVAAGTSVYRPEEELTLSLGTAEFTLMPPVGSSGNELCMGILISSGDYDILVTGDMSASSEIALAEKYDIGPIDCLVVGHHGSASATSEDFLRRVMPKTAIISVGADNSYGHPKQEVLKRLRDIDCDIYRTDINGTVTVTVNEEQVK